MLYTDKLQQVLKAAAHVITSTQKYERGLTDILCNELHWLSVSKRVKFKHGIMMFRCLYHLAMRYRSDFCTLVANIATRSQCWVVTRYKSNALALHVTFWSN